MQESISPKGSKAPGANIRDRRCPQCVRCICQVNKGAINSLREHYHTLRRRAEEARALKDRQLQELTDQAKEQSVKISKLEAQLEEARTPILVDLEPEPLDVKPKIEIKTEYA